MGALQGGWGGWCGLMSAFGDALTSPRLAGWLPHTYPPASCQRKMSLPPPSLHPGPYGGYTKGGAGTGAAAAGPPPAVYQPGTPPRQVSSSAAQLACRGLLRCLLHCLWATRCQA